VPATLAFAAVAGSSLAARWLPVVVWAALIFTLSSIPSLDTGLGAWDLGLRKLAHVAEYAVLGALLARALPELAAQWAGIAYAVSDELHQSFVPGRFGTLLDVAIDSTGVLVGILLLRRVTR
jgi:VanZ family protein